MHLHALGLFPYLLGQRDLQRAFKDKAEEVSALGETFLPLQLVRDGIAGEQVLGYCGEQAFLNGDPMHLTDEVVGEEALQVVS